jgi:hypothetical protein
MFSKKAEQETKGRYKKKTSWYILGSVFLGGTGLLIYNRLKNGDIDLVYQDSARNDFIARRMPALHKVAGV